MINEYNTQAPGTKSGGINIVVKALAIIALCYFGYKYFIKKPEIKEPQNQ